MKRVQNLGYSKTSRNRIAENLKDYHKPLAITIEWKLQLLNKMKLKKHNSLVRPGIIYFIFPNGIRNGIINFCSEF